MERALNLGGDCILNFFPVRVYLTVPVWPNLILYAFPHQPRLSSNLPDFAFHTTPKFPTLVKQFSWYLKSNGQATQSGCLSPRSTGSMHIIKFSGFFAFTKKKDRDYRHTSMKGRSYIPHLTDMQPPGLQVPLCHEPDFLVQGGGTGHLLFRLQLGRKHIEEKHVWKLGREKWVRDKGKGWLTAAAIALIWYLLLSQLRSSWSLSCGSIPEATLDLQQSQLFWDSHGTTLIQSCLTEYLLTRGWQYMEF